MTKQAVAAIECRDPCVTKHSHFVTAAAAVVLAIFALSGCSRNDESPPPPETAPSLPAALAPVYDEVMEAISSSQERKELARMYLARVGAILTAADQASATDAFVALLKLVDCRGDVGADVARTVNDSVSQRENLRKALDAKLASTKATVIRFADECTP